MVLMPWWDWEVDSSVGWPIRRPRFGAGGMEKEENEEMSCIMVRVAAGSTDNRVL